MSGLRNIEAETVLRHARERLRALSDVPAGAAAQPVSRPRQNRFQDRYERLALRASIAAAKANPKSKKANLLAGIACRRAGDTDTALFYLRRAATHDGVSKLGNWELAKSLLRLGRKAADKRQARELLEALREASHSSDTVIRHAAALSLSKALYDAGEYAEAETAADVALSVVPEDIRAMRAKANGLVARNCFGEAEGLYRKMLMREPASAEIARKAQILETLSEESGRAGANSGATAPASVQPLLIGIGSGIGDILHVTPTIRNIARRTGTKVEVVVAGDHAGTEFLAGNENYVSRVWPVCRAVLECRYNTVFLTQFFGSLRFAFQADRIVESAQWRSFRAGGLNDTLLNLEAAKHLLGIPYDEADSSHYFAGSLLWQPPAQPLVGLHAGSKSGRWLSKRWPYFAGLAARLSARGIRVASFGTPDEYVCGTENRTGGTIEEMSRAMLACSHFVSNDSGPMHIASALGVPVLALYAPTDALSHLPMRATTTALALDKICSPCEIKDHPHFASGACKCIAEIPLEAVEARAMEMLTNTAEVKSREAATLRSEGVA